jgi:hypothetical protein
MMHGQKTIKLDILQFKHKIQIILSAYNSYNYNYFRSILAISRRVSHQQGISHPCVTYKIVLQI